MEEEGALTVLFADMSFPLSLVCVRVRVCVCVCVCVCVWRTVGASCGGVSGGDCGSAADH